FSTYHQIYLGIYPNAGPTCLTRVGENHVPAHRTSSRQLFPHDCLKIILFQISVPSISEKGNSHWAIVKLSDENALAGLVMVSSSAFMVIPILLSKLKNCCESPSGKSGATPIQSRFATQSGFETRIWNKFLLKQWCENSCRELDQWAGT
ncbi:hypothetical protein AVEN_201112-1, partial [Araneus ventricosus]